MEKKSELVRSVEKEGDKILNSNLEFIEFTRGQRGQLGYTFRIAGDINDKFISRLKEIKDKLDSIVFVEKIKDKIETIKKEDLEQ